MAAGTCSTGTQALTWKKGLLVPRRFELSATPGRSGAIAFRSLYRPRRLRARAATAVSLFAMTHGIGRTSAGPGDGARELCELVGVAPDGGAVVRSRGSGRTTFGLTEHGRLRVVVKVAPDHDSALAHENEALQRLHGAIPGVVLPVVRWVGSWRGQLAMATDALALAPDRRDIDLEEALAIAIALARGSERHGPVVHGDFAPWNILRTLDGIALVDWESSRFELDPLYDLAHFVTSKGTLLGSHEPAGAVRLLTAEASPGWRYLEALGLDPRHAPHDVRRYLARTPPGATPTTRRYRQAMLALLPPTPGRVA
jgi:hypothetical protein